MGGTGRLRAHRDFLKLWGGETASLFGSQVTLLTLPLTAALTLGATPARVVFPCAASFAPFLTPTLLRDIGQARDQGSDSTPIGQQRALGDAHD